jgi:hypothetical protein
MGTVRANQFGGGNPNMCDWITKVLCAFMATFALAGLALGQTKSADLPVPQKIDCAPLIVLPIDGVGGTRSGRPVDVSIQPWNIAGIFPAQGLEDEGSVLLFWSDQLDRLWAVFLQGATQAKEAFDFASSLLPF